jgi:signal transduction histidine kinase
LELARSRIELRQALAEAEASRARLVQAGDEERRRLERDIHDGAQQQLVAIGMSLKLAQARLDPHDGAHSAIGNAVADLQGALAELRRIASGVRPRGLDEGLATALRHLIRSSPLPVDLRVTSEALPSAVSTTAYYVAAEGLANALKHARPTTLTVDISRSNGVLHVVVTDDGSGGAVVRLGSGLAGLRDRVLADGGELVVESPPGEGTIVRARLPCES